MQPNLELARLIGSAIAHKSFGDEFYSEWARKLTIYQRLALSNFEDHGVAVFDGTLLASRQSAEVISRASISMAQALEGFRQLGVTIADSLGASFVEFGEAITAATAPLQKQYERYQRDVIYLRLIAVSIFGWHFLPEWLCEWISENYPLDWTPGAISSRFDDWPVPVVVDSFRERIDAWASSAIEPIKRSGLICRIVGHEYWMTTTQPDSRSVMPGFRHTCERCGDIWKPKHR